MRRLLTLPVSLACTGRSLIFFFTFVIFAQQSTIGLAATPETVDPLQAVVRLITTVPPDARTARSLGTTRAGNGILISDDGLVLTIGYLILEANDIKVVAPDGDHVSAAFVAYDHASGFGLLRAGKPLGLKAVRLGDSEALRKADYVVAAASGGESNATVALVLGRRPFAGAWEYLLERAIFTSPPIREFGGAGLFGRDGRLVGVGSLLLRDVSGKGGGVPGNMFVPIELLKPILGDLLAHGRSSAPPRPWLGLYPVEVDGVLRVNRVATDGPAEAAGLAPGDVVLGVGEQPVREMDHYFRMVWALGEAGTEVPLKVLKDGEVRDIIIKSGDRMNWLRMKPVY